MSVQIRATPIMETLTGIMIAALIYYSGILINNNELDINNFFSFFNPKHKKFTKVIHQLSRKQVGKCSKANVCDLNIRSKFWVWRLLYGIVVSFLGASLYRVERFYFWRGSHF